MVQFSPQTNYTDPLTATIDVASGVRTWYGPQSCAVAAEDKPALPEEAEELAYVGTCSLNQVGQPGSRHG